MFPVFIVKRLNNSYKPDIVEFPYFIHIINAVFSYLLLCSVVLFLNHNFSSHSNCLTFHKRIELLCHVIEQMLQMIIIDNGVYFVLPEIMTYSIHCKTTTYQYMYIVFSFIHGVVNTRIFSIF